MGVLSGEIKYNRLVNEWEHVDRDFKTVTLAVQSALNACSAEAGAGPTDKMLEE